MTWVRDVMIVGWAIALILLLPPLWRLVLREGRYLDALWGVCLLGVVNRLAMGAFVVPPAVSDAASALLAILFALAVRSYQRADRDR